MLTKTILYPYIVLSRLYAEKGKIKRIKIKFIGNSTKTIIVLIFYLITYHRFKRLYVSEYGRLF